MKSLTLLLFVFAFNTMAGLESAKKKYESDIKKAQKRYLYNLKIELQRTRDPKEIVAIDKEISRIETILNPMSGNYIIKYDTGIRNYKFNADGTLYFVEGGYKSKFIRRGDIIIIKHKTGEVETWERQADGTWNVGFQNSERLIPGKARKK